MDFLKVNTDSEEKVAESFDNIAKELFDTWEIVSPNGNHYRFAEIEFYFHSKEHPDPFTYGSQYENGSAKQIQQTNGQWYIHWSGIDITIGNSIDYGGILIRGVKNIETDKYISGPLKTMMELLSFDVSKKNMPVNGENGIKLFIKPYIGIKKSNLYKSKRVGLNPKEKIERENYVNKEYRYVDVDSSHGYKNKTSIWTQVKIDGV